MTIPELIRDLSISEAKRFDSANLEPSHLLAVLAYRFMIKYDMMDRARAVSKKSHGKSSFHGTVVISDELDQMIDSCKTKEDIAILQEKLQKLEEHQRTKLPIEKAFYRVYGCYPPTTPSVSNSEDERWSNFQNGYNASKEECKVEEEPKPTPETLYQMFNDEKWSKCGCDHICKVVEEWMSQYTCETNKWDEDYKCGFLDCLDVLRKNLK